MNASTARGGRIVNQLRRAFERPRLASQHVGRDKNMNINKLNRRHFLGTSAAVGASALTGIGRPGKANADNEVIKIGFLAPLTGDVAAWGLPGLYGCEIWADNHNLMGGVEIGGTMYNIEIVSYDNEYLPDKAKTGATKLIK
jgi:branched-chain amino acid transport system substrate-binding protein